MAVNPFTMQPTDNPFFQPQNLLQMAGGMLQAPNFAQGAGNSLATLGQNVAVAQEKREVTQKENATRAALQKLYPGQDLTSLQGPALHDLLVETQKRKMFPAAAEFKTLADGTFGTWDGKSFNRLGKAENPNDLPAAYRDWQEQQKNPAYAEHVRNTSKTGQTFEERKRMAQEMGMTEDDPAYRPFVLTGKMPREDQLQLTAGDKAQMYTLQDKIDANKATIANLKRVITGPEGETLNDKAGTGWGAQLQAFGARNDPTNGWLFDQEQGQATTEFDNVVMQDALRSLKENFGGAPSDGEREALKSIQASVDKTPAERKVILENAIRLAERRLGDAEGRMESIRDGDFYKPKKSTTSGTTKTGNTFEVLD